MSEPKRKHSKGRRDRRRLQIKIKMPTVGKCRHCGADKMPHRICPNCGKYK